MRKIVIWGASGHARVVADIIHLGGKYEIVGFLDDMNPAHHNTTFCGASIIGGREQLDKLRQMGVEDLIFAFGDSAARLKLSELVRAKGFRLATAIHPHAIIAQDVQIGQGTMIAAGAVVNPAARIGESVIINTSASVDHECIVEDGVNIAPGVCLGGKVIVGRGAWIGIGATIRDHVVIGSGSLIGAGAVVLEDIPDGVVAYGIPAKVIKKIRPNDC